MRWSWRHIGVFLAAAVGAQAAGGARAVCQAPRAVECGPAVERLRQAGVPVEVVAGEPEGRYIDASGHVWRTALTAPVAAGFVRWVRQLREGEAGYAIACARCHGAGGGDRSYPHIKPLPGIGGRLSREEIYRRLNPVRLGPGEISIRSHIFRPAQAEALVLYIAGL